MHSTHNLERLSEGVVDVAVIGAGVVGSALARRLVLDGARVVVLEKAADVLDGASKGNSAILHTGFDAVPNSLEQQCIESGYRIFLEDHQKLGLPILKTGALILAWQSEELEALEALVEKARQNYVADVQPLTTEEILSREPKLAKNIQGGFVVPGESLIDPWATAHCYLLQALANGAVLHRGSEVLGGNFDGDDWHLETSMGRLQANQVVSAAGLYGDIVDDRLIGERSFSITPRKGEFVVFEKAASSLVEHILLPVPSGTSKGVVVCRTLFGNVLVGPTAHDQHSRNDVSTEKHTLNSLRRKGIDVIPALSNCEVTATYAGLRPATEFSDYQINQHTHKHYISVGGIRSTGLSSALGIAEYVSNKLQNRVQPDSHVISHPIVPSADRLSDYHPRDWQEPGNEGLVCHCEKVTRREIKAVLNGPLPPATLQGLKRRTRVCMGHCQGFYCSGELSEMTQGYFAVPMAVDSQ